MLRVERVASPAATASGRNKMPVVVRVFGGLQRHSARCARVRTSIAAPTGWVIILARHFTSISNENPVKA
jgi:hypothetical protein